MEKPSSVFGTHHARVILIIVAVFVVTSTISIILRFLGKRIKRTKLRSDDWTIIAAQFSVYILATATILEVIYGNAGHHAAEAPSKTPTALKLLVAIQCLYATALALVKISICLFYNRILPFRSFHIVSWTIIAVVAAWASAVILYAFLSCRPFAMFWNPTISGGRCISNQVTAHVVFGVVGVVIDIAMFILPIPLLWSLRVSLADKVALFCIFGAGISTMVFSILRVECLVKVSFTDVTYTGAYALVWTFAEPAVGVSVACAPLTRPIFDRRSSDSDIELGSSNSRFHRLQAPSESLPSFVDPNVKIGKKKGLRGSYVTRQVQESGNWSQADRGGVVSETPERGLGT